MRLSLFPDTVTTISGSDVTLACNTSMMSTQSDAISLIFWYKSGGDDPAPIYTVDARKSGDIHLSTHFQTQSFSNRLFFNISVPRSQLTIVQVREADAGEYRCRVDFRWGRTINSITRLDVIGTLSYANRIHTIFRSPDVLVY